MEQRVCVSEDLKQSLAYFIEIIKMNEQDRLLPIANVGRIMKQILPPSAKISKEAKETIQECATEFISFVTGEASDKCHKENRKTVNGDDICWALSALGFDDYGEGIVKYLHRYREFERQKAATTNNINNNQHEAAASRDNDKDDEEKQNEAALTALELGGIFTGKN